MTSLERMLDRLCPLVFKAKENSGSELYKIFQATAESFELYYDQLDELCNVARFNMTFGDWLGRVGRAYGWEQFLGELPAYYKSRLKGMLGMPKNSNEYILNIIALFTIARPVLATPTVFHILITVPQGTVLDPNYYFSIGGPPDWGCGIGDTGNEFAGAVYASVTPGTFASLTYLQYVLDQIRPAGVTATIEEEGG